MIDRLEGGGVKIGILQGVIVARVELGEGEPFAVAKTHRSGKPEFRDYEVKDQRITYGEENIFCNGTTRAAKAVRKTLVPAKRA